jgi:hypothetical protein
MNRPGPKGFAFPRSASQSGSIAILVIALITLISQSGCRKMWQQVREGERTSALESARDQARRGECEAALISLDRAQASLNIGVYARESTVTRARCYKELGRTELAAAHRRLLTDFYENEPMAIPEPDGSSVFRVANVTFDGFNRPPSGLRIPAPRYNAYARRSGIIGRVVLSFDLASDGRPRMIRVVEMPHPLLASWAIEAVAQASFRKNQKPLLAPGEHYLSLFDFEWHWAREKEKEKEGKPGS